MESLIVLILLWAIVGVIAWLVITYVPMPAPMPQILVVVLCLILLIYSLQALGVFHGRL